MTITKIEIWSRGKYKDEYGNPYHAFKAVISCSYVSYFRNIIITMPMTWGSSGEYDCLQWAVQCINEALQTDIKQSDERIVLPKQCYGLILPGTAKMAHNID